VVTLCPPGLAHPKIHGQAKLIAGTVSDAEQNNKFQFQAFHRFLLPYSNASLRSIQPIAMTGEICRAILCQAPSATALSVHRTQGDLSPVTFIALAATVFAQYFDVGRTLRKIDEVDGGRINR
jgi:hypothetical protein